MQRAFFHLIFSFLLSFLFASCRFRCAVTIDGHETNEKEKARDGKRSFSFNRIQYGAKLDAATKTDLLVNSIQLLYGCSRMHNYTGK